MRQDIIGRDDGPPVKEVDKGIKNIWRWDWLERRVGEQHIGDFIRKVRIGGKAFCTACYAEINYGGRGVRALEDHLKSKKHADVLKLRGSNYRIAGTQPDVRDKAYGVHPMFKGCLLPKHQRQAETQTFTPLADRIKNAEATILSFTAENSLSFSMVPRLIHVAQTLSKDKKALDSLKMERTTAAYKMQYGLAKTFKDNLVEEIQSSFFSLNIDEATSNNNQKVLAVLVSYFSTVQKEVVVNHLESVSLITVNSESLYKVLVELFEKLDISWSQCLSILMDSCAVMRGSKTGLETRIRSNVAKHLLDIDGDSCHHVHNSCKSFCKPFHYHIEGLMSDIHTDFKWSIDLREALSEICLILNIKYTVPQRYVSHRWMSVYDVALDTVRLLSAYTVFYYSFLRKEDKPIYVAILQEIYQKFHVPSESKETIRRIQASLVKKNLTPEGRDRKNRIVEKLFVKRRLSRLILHTYTSVLPLLKKYVMLFEMKEPMVHKLNDCQEDLLREFLSCFVKPEALSELRTGKQLKCLNLDTEKNILPVKDIFTGSKTSSILEKMRSTDSKEFLDMLKCAYVACGKHLQRKMPLDNDLLIAISAIDPVSIQHSAAVKLLLRLPKLVTNVLKDDEMEAYELEVRKLSVDNSLPPYVKGSRIDIWWGHVQDTNKYPLPVKMVTALLSCFHGPQVESSFSVMGDVLDSTSASMKVETFSAIQTVKYAILSSKKDAVSFMQKDDPMHDPVDPKLCANLSAASKMYKEKLLEDRRVFEEKKKLLGVELKVVQTKKRAKELSMQAASTSRHSHTNMLKRKYPSITKPAKIPRK